MGHLVTVTAEYIKNLIVVIAQTKRNAVEAVAVTTVDRVVLHSMIEVTAGEPEITVWIAVDGLSEDVRGATHARVVTTIAIVQSFPVEMIGIKNVEVAESSMIR